MGIACRLLGHKWMGAKCARCGEIKGQWEQEKALRVLEQLTDEKEIIRFAFQTKSTKARIEAQKRIKDPQALAELALQFFDPVVIERIDDPEVLKKIVCTAPLESAAAAALTRIADEVFLRSEIVENKHLTGLPCLQDRRAYRSDLKKTAIKKLRNQEYLFRLAMGHVDAGLFEDERELAVRGIDDLDKLFALAKADALPHQLAAAAISRMSDRAHLEWLSQNAPTGNIRPTRRQMAVMRLKGEVFYTPKY